MSRTTKALVVMAVALVFAPAVWRLLDVGRTNEYAGHAMFVPLFSALAAWMDRARLRAAAGPGHRSGAALVVAGLVVLATGHLWQSDVVQGLALVVAAAGVVLWLFGGACLRAAAFPVGFLVMMAPVPRPIVSAVTLELQAFAAGFATAALRVFDVPVYQTGLYLELPNLTLKVAEVCNGLRFLLALLVMTAAFAQVTLPTWGRKVVLIAAVAPIAILANAIRVAVVGVGVYYVGPEAAQGTLHDWIGKGVWGLTLLPLALLGIGLARWPRSRFRAIG